jgi:hypothetical protein
MYQERQNHEELAGLFARSMNISNPTPPPETRFEPPQPPAELPQQLPTEPIVYASMHYTHSRHVVPVRFSSTPETTPEPQRPLTNDEMYRMLLQNGINPHSLFPAQVHLFRHADLEQRLRLLELWSISPPDTAPYDLLKQQEAWSATSIPKEMEMARLRFERVVERNALHTAALRSASSDAELAPFHPPQPSLRTDVSGAGPATVQPERPASAPGTKTYAEPYMSSGYEMLAKREYDAHANTPLRETTRYNQATDPAYIGFQAQKPRFEDAENHALAQDEDMEL